VFLASVLTASAQVVVNLAQARVEFTAAQHDAVFQPGTVGAGDPMTAAYRALVIVSTADPVTGVPVFNGGPTPKSLAVIVGVSVPVTYSLSFAQLGISAASLPACAAALCPTYAIVLVASGSGGTSARSATAASDAFTQQGLVPQTPPAAPANAKVKGTE
jgi:hypothetical protein